MVSVSMMRAATAIVNLTSSSVFSWISIKINRSSDETEMSIATRNITRFATS